jgi:hypothetical protein
MVLTDRVFIKMNAKHISTYRKMGYLAEVNEIVEVSINDLPLNSHSVVEVKCDVCESTKKLRYQVYNKSFLNQGYYACSIKCGYLKYMNTNLLTYGVDNYAKTKECRIKTEKTCLERYGESVPARNSEVMSKIQNSRVKNGLQNPIGEISEFNRYKKIVRRLTQKNKKKLLENWDGFDFYDNKYIKENFNLSPNNSEYPTIDHKISIYRGFVDNIDPTIISNLDNLCITKRTINSSKQAKDYGTFRDI